MTETADHTGGSTDSTGSTDGTDSTGSTGNGTDTDAAIGYERARDELADVVRRLEAGGLSLEESLALWERGEALARVCERKLAGARRRIDAALAGTGEGDGEDR